MRKLSNTEARLKKMLLIKKECNSRQISKLFKLKLQVQSGHMPIIDSGTMNQFDSYFDNLTTVFFYYYLLFLLK